MAGPPRGLGDSRRLTGSAHRNRRGLAGRNPARWGPTRSARRPDRPRARPDRSAPRAALGAGQRQERGHRCPRGLERHDGKPLDDRRRARHRHRPRPPRARGRIWTNPGEVAADGVDNDGNGYVDDIRGWNFANAQRRAGRQRPRHPRRRDDRGGGETGSASSGSPERQDHGPEVPGRRRRRDGRRGDRRDRLRGAARRQGHQRQLDRWRALEAAGRRHPRRRGPRRRLRQRGGQRGGEQRQDSRPTGHRPSNQITVAAIDSTGKLAAFSNYGRRSVDLVAPGVEIWSTVPGGYGSYTGTSMAAPHVSGVVALLAGLHPEYTAEQLVARVLATTKPLGRPDEKDQDRGHRRCRARPGRRRPLGNTVDQAPRRIGPTTFAVARGAGRIPGGPRQRAIPRAIPLRGPDYSSGPSSSAMATAFRRFAGFPCDARPGMIRGRTVPRPAHGGAMPLTTRHQPPSLRDAIAVSELFIGVFRRDLLAFYPHGQFERVGIRPTSVESRLGAGLPVGRAGRPRRSLGRDPIVRGGVSPLLAGRDAFHAPRPADDPCHRRGLDLALSPPVPGRACVAAGAVPRRVGRPLRGGLRRAVGLCPPGHPDQPDRLHDPDLAHRRTLDLREPAGLHRRPPARAGRRIRPARSPGRPPTPSPTASS